ncbi:MAG: hypothetical protein IT318_07175 [Anaerolineales bacterium]|nr:hypothetical protein [Anaerolineales bacterium]
MAVEPLRLRVEVGLGDDAPIEERHAAALLLGRELEDAGMVEVEPAMAGPAPPGTRSADAIVFGALMVSALPAALQTVVAVLADWARRRPERTLALEYETGGQRFTLEYDPAKTDPAQLLAVLMQAQAAPAPRAFSVGGDLVGGDKVSHSQAGGDSVGRDKITEIHVAPGSTLILNDSAPGKPPAD